ncbi:hypothetical protein TIFTF001_008265 [Ficus carica]|uniref:Uncharacterized protein n=1 Tax=Ficus carica TaxID=3494 RepID=A0AA88DGY7_FICCA|nr:hypothetical protein TIFTF001_008265 [Ficus carica]
MPSTKQRLSIHGERRGHQLEGDDKNITLSSLLVLQPIAGFSMLTDTYYWPGADGDRKLSRMLWCMATIKLEPSNQNLKTAKDIKSGKEQQR